MSYGQHKELQSLPSEAMTLALPLGNGNPATLDFDLPLSFSDSSPTIDTRLNMNTVPTAVCQSPIRISSRLENFVWLASKPSTTSPIGPLRCLAMRISAVFGRVESVLPVSRSKPA